MNHTRSPQASIEAKMREIAGQGSYDMVHLFSNEGLPLAEHYRDNVVDKDRLVELSLLLRKVREMADVMAKISDVKEIIVEGFNSRKIVFRFFRAFGQDVALAVVVPPRKSYRQLTNSLIKVIEEASF